jgi:hypothetical protein
VNKHFWELVADGKIQLRGVMMRVANAQGDQFGLELLRTIERCETHQKLNIPRLQLFALQYWH